MTAERRMGARYPLRLAEAITRHEATLARLRQERYEIMVHMYSVEGMSQRAIAAAFKVSQPYVQALLQGR